MLAKIAPRFIISRVIQTSYFAQFMAVELVKQPIGESAISFYFDDPKKYYVNSKSFRNATSTVISLLWTNPLNFLISLKPRSIIKLCRNSHFTTMLELFMKNWMSLHSKSESSIEVSKPTIQVQTFSHGLTLPMM
jgi:hypothetical protein